MRSIVAVAVLALAVSGCPKKPKPPLVVDAGAVDVAFATDAGAPVNENVADGGSLARAPDAGASAPVDNVPAPMVIAGFNVPQPRGFRRAQKTDALGSPQIDPWLARGDIVLIDEAAFPPGTVDVGFVSMLNLPQVLTLEECTKLAKNAAVTESGELVGEATLLETGLGPTCKYEIKQPAGVVRGAIAAIESRALGIMAAHGPTDEKTATAWNEVVTGMRKTNP